VYNLITKLIKWYISKYKYNDNFDITVAQHPNLKLNDLDDVRNKLIKNKIKQYKQQHKRRNL
jgi:hypothetical protein